MELLRNSIVVLTTGPGAGSYDDPFSAGTWTYRLRATNSVGKVALSQSITVTPVCIVAFSVVCDTSGDRNKASWLVLGNASGTVRLFRRYSGQSSFDLIHAELLAAVPRTFTDVAGEGQAADYQLQVLVGGRTVNSPLIYAACPPPPTPVIT